MERRSHFHQETHRCLFFKTKQQKQSKTFLKILQHFCCPTFVSKTVGEIFFNDNSRYLKEYSQDYCSPCFSKCSNHISNLFQIDVGQIHFDLESDQSD